MNTGELHSVHTYQYQSGLIAEDDVHFRDAAQLAEYHEWLGVSKKIDSPEFQAYHTATNPPIPSDYD